MGPAWSRLQVHHCAYRTTCPHRLVLESARHLGGQAASELPQRAGESGSARTSKGPSLYIP